MSFLCIGSAPLFNKTIVTDVNDCNGYIAEPAKRFQETPTLYDLFTVPLVEDLQTMFMLGISLPVIAYLTSSAYGSLINWFSDNEPDKY